MTKNNLNVLSLLRQKGGMVYDYAGGYPPAYFKSIKIIKKIGTPHFVLNMFFLSALNLNYISRVLTLLLPYDRIKVT